MHSSNDENPFFLPSSSIHNNVVSFLVKTDISERRLQNVLLHGVALYISRVLFIGTF